MRRMINLLRLRSFNPKLLNRLNKLNDKPLSLKGQIDELNHVESRSCLLCVIYVAVMLRGPLG